MMRISPRAWTMLTIVVAILAFVVVEMASDSGDRHVESSFEVDESEIVRPIVVAPVLESPLATESLANVDAAERTAQPTEVASLPTLPESRFASLEGYVTVEGRTESPRGWAVSAVSKNRGVFARAVFVAADGFYRIDEIAEFEPFVLRIKVDGELIHQEGDLALARGVRRHDIVVRPEVVARGRVVDADTGAPLAGARVSVEFVSDSDPDPDYGADGRYSYTDTLRDGSFELRGVAPSFADAIPAVVVTAGRLGLYSTVVKHRLDELRAMGPIELRIGELGTIEGRLLDSSGGPIEGAEIEMAGSEPGRPTRGGAPCQPQDAEVAADDPRTISVYPSRARTDRDGAFRITGVAHGAQPTLRLRVDGSEFRYRTERRFERCGEIQRIEIRLPVTSTLIVGRVTLDGRPIVAKVFWHGTRFTGDTESDDEGAFVLERVEEGRVVVKAIDPFTRAEVSRVIESMPRGTLAVELAIELHPYLRGVVRFSDGRPVAGMRVSATLDSILDGERSTPSATAITDPSGAFEIRIEDLTGPYRVELDPSAARALGVADPPVVRAPPGASELVLELRK